MRPTRIMLVGGFVLGLGLVSYGQPGQNAGEEEAKLVKLKRDRAATAKELWEATRASYTAGVTTLDVLLSAAERRRDAELSAAQNEVQKLQALRDHLERVKKVRDQIQTLVFQGGRGGEADKRALSELVYQDAEIALLSALDNKQDRK
jgi:hypothetical protein